VKQTKNVPISVLSSFQGAICTENSSLGPDEVSLFHKIKDVLILQGCYEQDFTGFTVTLMLYFHCLGNKFVFIV
jgi:hypothetical protein